MGLLSPRGKKATSAAPAPAATPGGAATNRSAGTAVATRPPRGAGPATVAGRRGKGRGRKGAGVATGSGPSATLNQRRKRLLAARDVTLRDLGGLMLEMYKRNRFREELLLDKCEEVLAIEVEVAHIDQRLFQLAPATAGGQKPIGRCECGATLLPGQNFCGACGRALATLAQARPCERCGTGLRPGDTFCGTCGTRAPDVLEVLESPSGTTAVGHVPTTTTAPPSLAGDPLPASAASATAVVPPVRVPLMVVPEQGAPAAAVAATPDLTTAIPVPAVFAGATSSLHVAPAAPHVDLELGIDAALVALPASGAAVAFPAATSAATAAPAAAMAATPGAPLDERARKRLAKERAKQRMAQQKAREKDVKARAKERLREARARAKGDGGS